MKMKLIFFTIFYIYFMKWFINKCHINEHFRQLLIKHFIKVFILKIEKAY